MNIEENLKGEDIIIGIVNKNDRAVKVFFGIFQNVIENKEYIDEEEKIEIFQELIERILLNNRNIVDRAKDGNMSKSFIKQWIRWNISDILSHKNKQPIYSLANIISDSIYELSKKDRDIEEAYIHFVMKSLTISENLLSPEEYIENKFIEQKTLKFCKELIRFISIQKDIEQKIFCSYLKYIEKPKDIKQNNYNQIFRRLKLKIRNFISSRKEEFKEIILNNYSKFYLCDFEQFCKRFKNKDDQ